MNMIQICNDYRDVWLRIGEEIVKAADPENAADCWRDMTVALEPVFQKYNSADVSAAVAVYLAYISFELSKEVTKADTGERVPAGICLMAVANMANANLLSRDHVEAQGDDNGSQEESQEEIGEEENSNADAGN